ncbi:decaprenyl-diphosphate synthase subunit 2-like protein [Dinothrombium tinctorium]|uniref:Decaprenyl-diphosphate synthase subunit 2-like protein n=1 Tax=Dinothrombium tinctorium TaxID=1965070 RepID=A0A3S3QW64_9ACAR|nr:decaprenyl-diphosphate synthase subunit 2-like protein [Dinothrombium tinctorium]
MSDAEKIVGYSTSYFSLRCLLSDEISNVALHLSKLNGTNHPLLETAKRLTYNGHSVMQTRGLLVLLISKAAGLNPSASDYHDSRKLAGISQRQRFLAEITEMIYSAHLIHRGILNLQPHLLLHSKIDQDLHFGNKMSVLSGDFLLASVWKGLGELRDTKVVELMATAIGDFMEGQFVIETESVNPEEIKANYWEERNFLRIGSLQANSCQSALALAGHDEDIQLKAYQFGKHFALSWQAFTEMQPYNRPFMHSSNNASIYDLMSAPVLLHTEHTGDSLACIRKTDSEGKTHIDYRKLHSIISKGKGIEKTRELIDRHTTEALDAIKQFPAIDACNALMNIVFAVREQ